MLVNSLYGAWTNYSGGALVERVATELLGAKTPFIAQSV